MPNFVSDFAISFCSSLFFFPCVLLLRPLSIHCWHSMVNTIMSLSALNIIQFYDFVEKTRTLDSKHLSFLLSMERKISFVRHSSVLPSLCFVVTTFSYLQPIGLCICLSSKLIGLSSGLEAWQLVQLLTFGLERKLELSSAISKCWVHLY